MPGPNKGAGGCSSTENPDRGDNALVERGRVLRVGSREDHLSLSRRLAMHPERYEGPARSFPRLWEAA